MALRLLVALALLSPLPCLAQAEDDGFLDPAAGEPSAPAFVATPPPRRPPPRERSPIDPPRQTDRWELGASVMAFYTLQTEGAGFIVRAQAVYRFDLPLMVRAELTPLGFSTARDGRGAGAFGLASVGLDLHAFGAAIGVGALSNNEHDRNTFASVEPQAGAMVATTLTLRIGVSDGLALWLRSGIAFDHDRGRVETAVFEGWGQIPLSDVWAMRIFGSWTRSGNAEARVGMRAWLLGRGEAGSVALTLDGGLGRVVYHAPLRGRGYPEDIDHLGPGLGAGLEGRL